MVLCGFKLARKLIGHFTDKPTRGHSSHGLVNSPTANFFNHVKTTLTQTISNTDSIHIVLSI